MTEKSYDAIIIGGGPNGLTLAAYLQRAGMQVAIFERRHEEGGAAFTSECTAPGFLHNLHANYLITDLSPFYEDFELEKLGARFIYPEAQCGIAFSDGRPPIVLYNREKEENFKRTHQSIAQYSKQDADTYVELHRKAMILVSTAGAAMWFSLPPLPNEKDPDPFHSMGITLMKALGLPPHYVHGSGRTLIDSLFQTQELRTLLYKQVEEFGTRLEMMGTGLLALEALTYNSIFWRLSVGGTHTVAHAMLMACIREGVHFFENSEIKKIIVKRGNAVGVRLVDGTEVMAGKLVASCADLKQTLLGMVGEENLSPLWLGRARDFKVGTTCTLASTALALHEAPDFKSARYNADINKTFYTVVGFDEPYQVLECKRDIINGKVPKIPGAAIWVNSLLDPTYAPAGKHSLCGWLDFPAADALSRQEWEEVRISYNDRFIDHFSHWAPNMTRANVIAAYFYTPLEQQEEMRLGDWSCGSITPDQVFHNRPFPEASRYRTEIKNLYLCGAYMYPGPGVHAGCGYNCFKRIAEDFGLDKFWERRERGY